MRIRGGGRQSGKTTEAVAWFRNNPDSVYVTVSHVERRRLVETYGLTEAEAKRIVVADVKAIRSRVRSEYPRPRLVVDNLDQIIPYLLGADIGMFTYTEEE